MNDLYNEFPSDKYGRLVQVVDGYFFDGFGNPLIIAGTSGGSSGGTGSTGSSGTSGTSGTSGQSGTSGINGTSGTSGLNGLQGVSGTSGTSGNSGVSGTSGTSGSAGTSGTSIVDSVSGKGTSGQISYWNGISSLTGSTDLTWDNSNLTINGSLLVTSNIKKSGGGNVNPQVGITYTFTLLDTITSDTIIPFNNSNPIAATIPTNASVAIPLGAVCRGVVQGTGAVTIGGAGITLVGRNFIFNQGDSFTITKIATDTWSVDGIYLPLGILSNVQTGTAYTLVQSDIGKQIICTNAAAVTITIPTGLTTDFNCEVMQQGYGQVIFVGISTLLHYSTFELPSIVERYGIVGIDGMPGLVNEFNLFGQLSSI